MKLNAKGILLKVVLPVGAAITVIIAAVIVFYLTSFIKLNDMLKIATTKNISQSTQTQDSLRFTSEQLLALKITDNEIGENDYIEYEADKKISAISLGAIEYTVKIDARKLDWDTWEEKETYQGTRIVAFKFDTKKFSWQVESVYTPQ